MSTPFAGMTAGTALAFAGRLGGFGAFLLVAALGALGRVLGRWVEGGGAVPPALRAVTAAAPDTAYTRVRPSAASHRVPRVR